jgi:hypothetical protein
MSAAPKASATVCALIRYWHGPLTAAMVAGKLHMASAQIVRNHWSRLKKIGRLPSGERPHFIVGEIDSGSLDRDIERSEQIAEATGLRIPDHDPLLAALTRAHGTDPRRRFDNTHFDDRRVTPTPRHSSAQIRFRDRSMALLTNQMASKRAAVFAGERS